MLLRRHLPGAAIVANPDRIEGGRQAMAQGAEVIIADDAYQHRRLGRDLNLCLVDAVSPFGEGAMLPAGRLREPMTGFSRADIVILSRCDQVEESKLAEIEMEVRRWAGGDVTILRSSHVPNRCEVFSGREFEADTLKWKKVFAWAGIGRPEAFYESIRRLGAELVGTRTFRDHYRFTADDLRSLKTQAERCGAEMMICTEKDFVKIDETMFREAGLDSEKLAALKIEIHMNGDDEQTLRSRVEKVMREFSREKLESIR
jgi:tetraacyldisaccharide 4'-kinase